MLQYNVMKSAAIIIISNVNTVVFLFSSSRRANNLTMDDVFMCKNNAEKKMAQNKIIPLKNPIFNSVLELMLQRYIKKMYLATSSMIFF